MKRALSELEQDDDSTPQAKKVKLNKPLCKYGANCYRKNPQHLAKYDHPWKSSQDTNGSDKIEETVVQPPSTSSTTTSNLPPCKYGMHCIRKNPKHFEEYSHPSGLGSTVSTSNSIAAQKPSKSTTTDVNKEEVTESDDSIPDSMEGITFAITGTLSLVRADVIKLINKYGGHFNPSVSKNVTYLLAEDPNAGSSKLQKAADLGIKVVGEDFLHKIIAKIESKKTQNETEKDEEEEADNNSSKAPVPLHHMNEGDSVKIQGGHGEYEIRLRGGVYYCLCPAWKNQNKPPDKRTCKHLREYLGDEFETWRVGTSSNAPAKVQKTDAPALLLAHKWEETTDPTGWWMSEKLDGVRAFWNGKNFISRLGNIFYAPEWFTKGLPRDKTLDGELFGGRKQFQSTVSIVKSQDQSEKWKQLVFRVFDIPILGDQPFEKRMAVLDNMFGQNQVDYVEVVEQVKCKGVNHLKEELARIEKLGGEGLMLRQPGSKYVGSRSSTLLKVKSFHDDEAQVVGYVPGKGKYKGMVGALEVKTKDGKKFSVGSGLSDQDRQNPPKIGSIITYRYQELTDGGIPRFPTYVGTRVDVKWTN